MHQYGRRGVQTEGAGRSLKEPLQAEDRESGQETQFDEQ